MSLKFKSLVMDGYQLADESIHSFKDKLYDKVKLSEAKVFSLTLKTNVRICLSSKHATH